MASEDASVTDGPAFLEAVRDLAPASTQEVADAVGCSRRTAEYRLRELYADGALESSAVGRELIWWPADER